MNDGLSDAEMRRAAHVEVLDANGHVLASTECFLEPNGLHMTGLPVDLYGMTEVRLFDAHGDLIGTLPASRGGLH